MIVVVEYCAASAIVSLLRIAVGYLVIIVNMTREVNKVIIVITTRSLCVEGM